MKTQGQWIDPAKAGDIPKLLDQALAGPNKPTLAWVGIKGPGNRAVHVKGQNGQTAELQWDIKTFTKQIDALADQWGGDSPVGGGQATGIDSNEIYARRRQQVVEPRGSDERKSTAGAKNGLPDPDAVYARRRPQAMPGGNEEGDE